MDVLAKITGIKYTPFLCKKLNEYDISNLDLALNKDATFILNIKQDIKIAVSWWASPKRTRSYPYARVYDSLNFHGKKITIIPAIKDEGLDGDRDFLQWDSVSLMSLLGIYVIISYYNSATKNFRYQNKITNQKFDILHINEEINNILSYQSDALHWNIQQLNKIAELSNKALDCYKKISDKLDVKLHSFSTAHFRINQLINDKENFMNFSRALAKKAQHRETLTKQPKEKLSGLKATLTIKNYLGGYYYYNFSPKLAKICIDFGKSILNKFFMVFIILIMFHMTNWQN
ncbi:MAG: hypothetical protein WHS65_12820 [Melioribacteraceae bacterium]